ncbi:MAG: ComF family protein [Prevotella sp.]|nr:ComF family protein [Prevotella sp.]
MKTSFLTDLFDLIAPRSCAICGKRLSAAESVICGVCHLRMPLTGFAQSPLDNPMARLFWGQFPIEKAAAYFYYQPHSDTSSIIYHLKYHSQPDIGENMGGIMARELSRSEFFSGIDAIVPIPITRRRRWQRGYNQSLEIARGISEVTHLPILKDAVRRTRFDTSQTKKKGWQRQENVADVFQLRQPEAISGRHLLLVDDIVTTGATIRACALELCKAGDVRISVVSLGFTKK